DRLNNVSCRFFGVSVETRKFQSKKTHKSWCSCAFWQSGHRLRVAIGPCRASVEHDVACATGSGALFGAPGNINNFFEKEKK
ncbi:hypothetical protein KA005_10540, partial [bacterium]|nr:hypothetical protein [bacterium]